MWVTGNRASGAEALTAPGGRSAVIGWPLSGPASTAGGLGWPVRPAVASSQPAVDGAVSRETDLRAPGPRDDDGIREELAASIPDAGDDTPLAQSLAQDARRR